MPIQNLRPYQEEALGATLEALATGRNPVISMPTGSGKSRVIAALCQSLQDRILVATHRKELLEQNSEELASLVNEHSGIYSAGLGMREAQARIIFGGIQSIYRRMDELQQAGKFAAIITDEAHMIGFKDAESVMYPRVFAACPDAKRIGLSATPYRLNGGPIWGLGDGYFFDCLAYEIGIRDLTPLYLAPLRGILTAHDIDMTGVRTAAGEFVLSDMSQSACGEGVVDAALDELLLLARNRQHWLVFCIDVAHTALVTEKLLARGIAAGMIVGSTDDVERAETLSRFKTGELRALLNCLVATTGFNIPNIDAVVLMRPTASRSLVIQMVGRGSRQAPSKDDCCVIDFAGNIKRHAPLDALVDCDRSPARQAKDELEKRKRKAAAARKRLNVTHNTQASTLDPFGTPVSKLKVQRVLGITYELQASKKLPGKTNVVVTYRLDENPRWVKLWLVPEYPRQARYYTELWFQRRGLTCPETAEAAKRLVKGARMPNEVVVDRGGEYPRVVQEHFEIRD